MPNSPTLPRWVLGFRRPPITFHVSRYPPHAAPTASYMATTLAGGTSARMLCTCWKMNPPPGRIIFTCWRTCSVTCAGVPLIRISRVSQPPPQNVSRSPKTRFRPARSIPPPVTAAACRTFQPCRMWEPQPVPEVALEAGRVHSPAGNLHRVDRLQARINQARQQLPHAAAAMQHDLEVRRPLLDDLPHRALPGLEVLAIHRGRHLGAGLHPQVIAEQDHVNVDRKS